MRAGIFSIVTALIVSNVSADVYMHNLGGSNNRNRERNENRNNNNRIFDSQNNAKGGYPWRGDRTVVGKPDPLTVYEGSMIKMEWTAQHSCANPNSHCQVVFQYACEDSLPAARDGYPNKAPDGSADANADADNAGYPKAYFQGEGQNADGTNGISQATQNSKAYGMHENFAFYSEQCEQRQRNAGLYTADQKLAGQAAKFTRQNPNGGRSGFECPEERDYYPNWAPNQWRDVAVLTSNMTFCGTYETQSQNVADTFYCAMTEAQRQAAPNDLRPIEATVCTQNGGTWTKVAPFGIPKPKCQLHDFSRDNHLGNIAPLSNSQNSLDGQPETAGYDWELPFVSQIKPRAGFPFDAKVNPPNPKVAAAGDTMWTAASDPAIGLQCVARVRYNISTNDYPAMKGIDGSKTFMDSKFNCPRNNLKAAPATDVDAPLVNTGGGDELPSSTLCNVLLDAGGRPRYNRPYVQVLGDSTAPQLSLAINTNQAGRTFQDRSYVFAIKPRAAGMDPTQKIWNLNNRGRRGNIVQSYPAVEYDFVPRVLNLNKGDAIQVQFHGSDFNTDRQPNNGEGWRFSDRFNMVQASEANTGVPLSWKGTQQLGLTSLFTSETEARSYAILAQDEGAAGAAACKVYKNGDANEDNAVNNCGKLNNAKAHMTFPLKQVADIPRGTMTYMSTRNNNFSNRSQKGVLIISGFTTPEVVGISVGVIVGAGLVAAGGFIAVRRGVIKVPDSWSRPIRLGSHA